MARNRQTLLPFAHVRNRGLFSNHWFENRLPLEPEWSNAREAAVAAFDIVVELWKHERGRVELYGAEAALEHAFIQPVLEAIGWKIIYQTRLEGRGPDYALFISDEAKDAALRAERTSPEFWSSVEVVGEAKAWHIPLNKPTVVNNRREYPPQQIEWYLDRSRRDFGVSTNGGLWRLIPREREPHQRRFQTYLECDLAALLEAWPSARGSITDRESLLDEFVQSRCTWPTTTSFGSRPRCPTG